MKQKVVDHMQEMGFVQKQHSNLKGNLQTFINQVRQKEAMSQRSSTGSINGCNYLDMTATGIGSLVNVANNNQIEMDN